jgi:polyhydroxybutyrate depolymerase
MLVIVILACFSPFLSGAIALAQSSLAPGDYEFNLTHGKRVRTYLLHVPPHAATRKPLPIVLVFHGGGGNAKGQKAWCGLDGIADQEGFLAVYPNGTGRFSSQRMLTWNAGTCCGYARAQAVDDVGFVIALLTDLAVHTSVDPTRVYATGMSNGAMMSYRLAVEASERIAAIAPVAGSMVVESFTPRRPMSVMHFHSVDDTRALYQGGWRPLTRVMHTPVEETIARWVRYDDCSTPPQIGPTLHGTVENGEATHTATKILYGPCRQGTEVVLWKLTGAGHVWPGPGPTYPKWLLGTPTRVINASQEMWKFFRRFTRPDAPSLTRGNQP